MKLRFLSVLALSLLSACSQKGRVEEMETPRLCRGGHRLGHAVGGKHHRAVVGNFIELIDEHRAQIAQAVDDEAVVDDLVAHEDRRAEPFERELDDLDRAVDARTEATGGSDQDAHVRTRFSHRQAM